MKSLLQVERLLIPVTLNILLTLIVWVGVYQTKTDSNSVFYYMLDPKHNRTTGSEIVDGMVGASNFLKIENIQNTNTEILLMHFTSTSILLLPTNGKIFYYHLISGHSWKQTAQSVIALQLVENFVAKSREVNNLNNLLNIAIVGGIFRFTGHHSMHLFRHQSYWMSARSSSKSSFCVMEHFFIVKFLMLFLENAHIKLTVRNIEWNSLELNNARFHRWTESDVCWC